MRPGQTINAETIEGKVGNLVRLAKNICAERGHDITDIRHITGDFDARGIPAIHYYSLYTAESLWCRVDSAGIEWL